MKTAAIFDIDGTLLKGNSEEYLIEYLLHKKKINFFNVIRILTWFLLHKYNLTNNGIKIRTFAATLLKGWDIKEASKFAEECFIEKITPNIFKESKGLIEKHRKMGHVIILNTACFDFVANQYLKYFSADVLICTKLSRSNNKYNGQIDGLINYGENKAIILSEMTTKLGIDFPRSFAYSNNKSDISLLNMVGNKVTVNPEKELTKIAIDRNWPILKFNMECKNNV
jgi:HAD superfamily hydrolase (TIGR01490 family)